MSIQTTMTTANLARPDVTLLLDTEGLIQEVTLSDALSQERVDTWIGHPWIDTVSDGGGDKVKRMVEDAHTSRVSVFRQLTQRFPSGLEVLMEYTTVRLGEGACLLAIGKSLQAVAELQSRLIAAQQAMERDYWRLREIETRYRLIFNASSEAVLMLKAATLRIVEANAAAISALGLALQPEAIAGREILAQLEAEEREPFQAMLQRVREQGKTPGFLMHLGPEREPWVVRTTLVKPEAGPVFLLQLAPVWTKQFSPVGSEPVAIEKLIERSPDGFAVLNSEGVILRANRALLDMVQAGAEQSVVGERLGRWLGRPGADMTVLLATVQRHGVVRLFSTTVHGELGTDTEVEISAAGNVDNNPQHYGVLLRDVGCRLMSPSGNKGLIALLDSLSEQVGKTTLRNLVDDAVSVVERHYIDAALELTGGNRTAAAELLGLSRQSLYAKLDRYGIDGNAEKASSRASNAGGIGTVEFAPSAAPAFGQADLSNCEREQIHLAGSIQPHGALLVVRETDRVVVQASPNASQFLHLKREVLGRSLDELPGDLLERISPHLQDPLQAIPMAVRCRVGEPVSEFDGLLHRPPGGGLVIELERAGPTVDVSGHVEGALHTVVTSGSLPALCDETARIFKEFTGYDRVMVYRFDDDGHGEVISERRKPELEPFLGNRYPSTDIPQSARRLYMRNRVRVQVDVEATPVPLTPRLSPYTNQDLDMSLCFLRSMSPIHIQYLKNMGVCATLVVSLVVGGKLWGLVACHHYAPRFVHYEIRVVCELLAETIATRISALESFIQARAELAVRRLEQRMVEAISREGDWRSALFDSSHSLLQPLDATGAALLFEAQVLTTGEVPGTQELREVGKWLDEKPRVPVFATASLGIDAPQFESLTSVASGLLAAPVSSSPGEYIMWFRPEQVRTVTWGGNPFKPMLVGDNPEELSPRRSFAQWHQLVEGTSEPWTQADLSTARLIGGSVADVILQFRSVRLLIAQHQLEQVSRQVEHSEQPVLITDPAGRIIQTNEPLERLLPVASLRSLEDLSPAFSEPARVERDLRKLVRTRRPWRGEVTIKTGSGETRPFLVRTDPVFSSPDRVLGFVLLFTELTEIQAADAARRRFQEDVIERHHLMTLRLDVTSDLVYRNLLSSVVENAQLAAMEITDGVDLSRMPEMLESVRASVGRTAELLEHVLLHTTGAAESEDPSDAAP